MPKNIEKEFLTEFSSNSVTTEMIADSGPTPTDLGSIGTQDVVSPHAGKVSGSGLSSDVVAGAQERKHSEVTIATEPDSRISGTSGLAWHEAERASGRPCRWQEAEG